MAFVAMESPGVRVRKDAALIPMRAALGSSMVFHGLGKLRAPHESGQFLEQSVGVSPGHRWAIATGVAEMFAGVSSILGVLTRPAALAVLVTQAVALWKVHRANGYDITKGGFEYNIALIAIAAGLLAGGPGIFSVHEPLESLVAGKGARKLYRKARPNGLLRLIKLLK